MQRITHKNLEATIVSGAQANLPLSYKNIMAPCTPNPDYDDEAAMVEEAVPTSPASVSSNKRLSTVSKMYDIDGDGQLDEAELKMRMLDQTGRGFLTNDKVYQLMQEQIADQKKMFQQKKIIIG